MAIQPDTRAAKELGTAGDALASRISSPSDNSDESTDRKVDEWLQTLPAVEAQMLSHCIARNGAVRGLLDQIAASSPYLWGLAIGDAPRLIAILTNDPDAHLARLFASTRREAAVASDEAAIMRSLRRMKAEAALVIALADIGGVWPVSKVTAALTALADTAVGLAIDFLLGAAADAGRLYPPDRSAPAIGSGYVVLAMGKMGAFELNYSSDIDLIVLYDRRAPAVIEPANAASLFVKITQGLVRLLQQRTGDGYVFRTDLRLRPDPASTSIAVSVDSALDYYGSLGLNWERAAMIKVRPCAGDVAAGETFLAQLTPFIWRKYLDYAAVADIEAMKRQIHAFKGHDALAVEGHNIKLGRGGIREIEFFVQTQQLIAGGRHPELRGRKTLDVLDALVSGGWVSSDARDDLHAAYDFLRRIEHRLQMVADEQTHTLPSDRAELERFARFAGYPGRDAFAVVLLDHMQRVQQHYSRLFEERSVPPEVSGLRFPAESDDKETMARLAAMGFRNPAAASDGIRRWLSGSVPALRGEQPRQHLTELMPRFLAQFAKAADPDATLLAFDRFVGALHSAGRFFSMLRQNPDLISLIALTLGTAPRLTDIVARYPEAMDAVLEPGFFAALPDRSSLEAELSRTLGDSRSYEDTLDRLRLFGQEQMFLIGAKVLSGTTSAAQAGVAFAGLADSIIREVIRTVEEAFVTNHGRIKGQRLALVALGKLGSREMTATSDLDIIVVYDFDDDAPQSDGERPLYGAQYFARFTQRLISALSAQTNYGALYQVDMRLRPSGRAGPLATRLGAFRDYQQDDAWTWEHMALTRARVIAGPRDFVEGVETTIQEALCRRRDPAAIAADVFEMRRAIAQEKGEGDRWNLKYAAGGLIDLEFIAQYLQLVHAADHPEVLDGSTVRCFETAQRLGLLSASEADILRPAATLFNDLSQILRLCLSKPFKPKEVGPDLLALLARAGDTPDFATLDAYVADTQVRVRESFRRIVGGSA